MNSLLSFLQNHYQSQLDQAGPLITAPEISDNECASLSVEEAREIIDWIVQQNWEAKVEYVYESIRHLCSPGLILLERLVDNGHANVLCEINPTSLSPVNSLIVAHALQVARNTHQVDNDRAQSVILLCLKEGDSDLMSKNFMVWMNDGRVADKALKILLERNWPMAEVLFEITDWVHALSKKSMWEAEFEPVNQWMSVLLSDAKFSGLIGEIAVVFERSYQQNEPNAAFFEQKFQEILSNCSLEAAKNYMQTAEASSADLLLPLFPERFKYELAQFSVVQDTPNAQRIREHKNIYEAVMGGDRQSHAKKI